MSISDSIVAPDEWVLVTGAGGFLGRYVVRHLLERGFRKIRLTVRSRSRFALTGAVADAADLDICEGDLRDAAFCRSVVRQIRLVFHLAADPGARSFALAYQNTVIPAWNLATAALDTGCLRRFVNVGSFASYDPRGLRRGQVLDETCPLVVDYLRAYNPYTFAKTEQDLAIQRLGRERGLPHTIVRPGSVYGPGARERITSRVGIDTFGIFLHLGDGGELPLTYVENCAEAIVLAGLVPGIDGEVFNIVDDFRPSSRWFLRWYRRHVRRFRYLSIPRPLVLWLCARWEDAAWKRRFQIPPAFNRIRAAQLWGGFRFSNQKAKERLGWTPRVPPEVALERYADYWKQVQRSDGTE